MAVSVNDIKTVVAEVININTGEKIEPVYEAYGYKKFYEFVEFYVNAKSPDKIAIVKGYAYDAEQGESVCVAEAFVGVNGQTTAFEGVPASTFI